MFSVGKKKEYSADLEEMKPSVKAKKIVLKLDRMKSLNNDSTKMRGSRASSLELNSRKFGEMRTSGVKTSAE